jgi:uncharacterized CHY-type Zn-finger protein
MANKNNATCSICGSEYYACLSCRDSLKANPWKMYTDTSEHYKVFQIVRGYNTGVYTKDEARTKLKNVNLDDIMSFRPNIKQIVEDILQEGKPVVKTVEKVDKHVEAEIATEEKVVVEKPVYSRKRSYKLNNEVEAE